MVCSMIWSSRSPRWYSGESACRTGLVTSCRNSVTTVFHSSELPRYTVKRAQTQNDHLFRSRSLADAGQPTAGRRPQPSYGQLVKLLFAFLRALS